MTKPRILIVENSVAITGALKSVVRSSFQLKDDFEFIFLLPAKSQAFDFVRQSGFDCYALNMREIRKNLFALLSYLPYLLLNTVSFFRLVTRLKIDAINVNDFYNLIPAVYRFFGGSKPYVCYVRFLPSKFPRLLVKLWCAMHRRYAEKIIAVSNAVERELPFQQKVMVIPNELPEGEVAYSEARSSTILYPANYITGKGHEYALESFSLICKKYPGWTLRFVGSDMGLQKNKEYKNWLHSQAESLGIAAQVDWGGFVEDMMSEYLAASLVLNFSESESFSLTCLEAMYCGRALVATQCGGPQEIVDHDLTGMLVPVADVKAMAKTIDLLLADAKVRDHLARNAYFSVRERFNHQKTIGPLKTVYLDLLNGI